jgi:type VI protein secretion system component VasK
MDFGWMHHYAWAVWLAVPAVLTLLAALVAWWMSWRARPARQPTTDEAMKIHAEYLAALTHSPRGSIRVGR